MSATLAGKAKRYAPVLIIAVIAVAAIRVLLHELRSLRLSDIESALSQLPGYALPLAALAVAGTYLALTLYDYLGTRYAGHPLPYRQAAPISFIAFVLSYNVGVSMLSGLAARYRMYSGHGFSTEQITKTTLFIPYSFWTGFALLSGLGLATGIFAPPEGFELPFLGPRMIGGCVLVIWGVLAIAAGRKRTPFKIRSWQFELPHPRLLPWQIAIATTEIILAALAFYLLLPDGKPPFLLFIGFSMAATCMGIASHVPGGIGVFDGILLYCLRPYIDDVSIVGALLVFRGLFYLAPLIAATTMLAVAEWIAIKRNLQHFGERGSRLAEMLAPRLIAAATLVTGVFLLATGATPILPGRLSWLQGMLPLPAIEASHFLGSVVGIVLIFEARAIMRRVDAAYFSGIAFLGLGAAFSIGKGEFGAAIFSLISLLALLPCRRLFFRKSSLLSRQLSLPWFATVASIVACTIWLGFFVYRNIDYRDDLWWQFSYKADASRFLRASTGAVVVWLGISVWKALKARRPRIEPPSAEASRQAEALVAGAPRAAAHLALLGDKSFLFSESGKSMIMYGISGDVWIALGDPLGDPSEFSALVWRFRELCDEHGDAPAFYNVGEDDLPLYLDAGFSLSKIGEDAVVDLPSFSLQGGSRKPLRAAISKIERLGCSFEVVPPEAVPALMPELKAVSDHWLLDKRVAEKGFTLGSFKESYLHRFPFAIVRLNGQIVAFANLWTTRSRTELSIDLMRHGHEAPSDTMLYLFTKIIVWAAAEGYQRFNLGMAPLSGLADHPLAPAWNRIGRLIFEKGEPFYNFQGLRQYKSKFDPNWEPRYLATLGASRLPQTLLETARISAGGWRQMFF